ncbi:MAG: lysoplasmalogenase family protein [Acidimicrobiales bacterium]
MAPGRVVRVGLFWILLVGAGVAAGADWFAVGTSDRRLEYVAKPAVLVALTVAAAAIPASRIDLVDRRWWFVAALVCCLVGDVLLMLPRDLFVPGLVAFLAGHLMFIVGLLQPPAPPGSPAFSFSGIGLAVAVAVVLSVEAAPGLVVIRSLVRRGQQVLIGPVCLYIAAIAAMAVLATNVGIAEAAAGAILFLASDTVLALDRFVLPLRFGPLAVHVTYHLAQGLLVLSLLH